MNEAGIGAQSSREIVDRFIASHGSRKPRSAILPRNVLGEPSLVVGLKRDAFGIHPGEVAHNFRRVDAGIEIGEVPFRQFPGLGCRFGLWLRA